MDVRFRAVHRVRGGSASLGMGRAHLSRACISMLSRRNHPSCSQLGFRVHPKEAFLLSACFRSSTQFGHTL